MELIDKIKTWLKLKKKSDPENEFFVYWQNHIEDCKEIDAKVAALDWTVAQMKAANPMLFDDQFLKRLVRACSIVYDLFWNKGKDFSWALYEERPIEILEVLKVGIECQVADAAEEAYAEARKQLEAESSKLHCLDFGFGTTELQEALVKSEQLKHKLAKAVDLASATESVMKMLHFHVELSKIAWLRCGQATSSEPKPSQDNAD